MACFDSGVKDFVTGECVITVHFPVDFKDRAEICCRHCPYLSSNERMCQLNKQTVHYPDKYVGVNCPLRINREEDFFDVIDE